MPQTGQPYTQDPFKLQQQKSSFLEKKSNIRRKKGINWKTSQKFYNTDLVV